MATKQTRAGSGVVISCRPSHKCVEPDPRKFDVGDVFVCDCGARYVLRDEQRDGPYWKADGTKKEGSG